MPLFLLLFQDDEFDEVSAAERCARLGLMALVDPAGMGKRGNARLELLALHRKSQLGRRRGRRVFGPYCGGRVEEASGPAQRLRTHDKACVQCNMLCMSDAMPL